MSFCQIEIRLVQVPHVLSLLCDQTTPWWIQPALPGDRQWCLSTKEWILRAIKKTFTNNTKSGYRVEQEFVSSCPFL